MGTRKDLKHADVHQQMTTRLSAAVVIHAAAFLVAVFSMGSESGFGVYANADSKVVTNVKTLKPKVSAVRTAVVESGVESGVKLRGQVRQLPSMPIVQAAVTQDSEDKSGGVGLTTGRSFGRSFQDEAITSVQYYSEN
jgi:hypothetical protein